MDDRPNFKRKKSIGNQGVVSSSANFSANERLSMFNSNFSSQPLYRLPDGTESACSNSHNIDAIKGRAGAQSGFSKIESGGSTVVSDFEESGIYAYRPVGEAKNTSGADGCFPKIDPGESVIVAELEGPAVITRIWLTFDWPGKSPYEGSVMRNRCMRMEITWDDAETPAVNVPVGDFFCHPLGYDMPFENSFFSAPTGQSLLCFIPMPFRKRATFRLINDFDRQVTVYHDIRFVKGVDTCSDDGYLHACFRRTIPEEAGMTHVVLPKVSGKEAVFGDAPGDNS